VDRSRRRPLAFTTSKVEGQRNEDSYSWSHKGVWALSDGASISFDSASWSQILVRRYCREPQFSHDWLSRAIVEFSALYNRDELPWMKQAAFDKGSFASFLGVQLHDDATLIQIIAIGDSLAVLCDGDRVKDTFPYRVASEFEQAPQLLSTNPSENAFLRDSDWSYNLSCDWKFDGLQEPTLLCMTDALGYWLLSRLQEGGSPITVLRKIRKLKTFVEFVKTERAAGRLRTDDTSLLALW
jgi:hypothetical protein